MHQALQSIRPSNYLSRPSTLILAICVSRGFIPPLERTVHHASSYAH